MPLDLLEELRRERGRSTPVLREIRRKHSKALTAAPASDVLQIAEQILEAGDPSVRVCARLVRDRDDMVVKVLSWALREVAKQNASDR